MKLSDVADIWRIQHQLGRTEEFKKLLMDMTMLAPGKFKFKNGSYIANWDEDPKVQMEISTPYLNVAGKPLVDLDAWGHVRKPVPRDMFNAFISYVDKQKLKLEKSQRFISGETWWVLKTKVPLERYSDEA